MIADRREFTTRTVEYLVPSGTNVSEFDKAWTAALAEYKRVHGLDAAAEPPSDWMSLHAGDDVIVLRLEFKTAAGL
ncbi:MULTISPECIES: hypothetical protein [unclassified Micromonospora]|uniref:hypothetical protein n=1 Tax=unclassified Micromonospora TaxID=2617518 RepID=UPI0033E9E4A1